MVPYLLCLTVSYIHVHGAHVLIEDLVLYVIVHFFHTTEALYTINLLTKPSDSLILPWNIIPIHAF